MSQKQQLSHEDFTVIMRTNETAPVVSQTLHALFSQELSSARLLVIDSGSTKDALDVFQRYPCELYTIDPEKYFPGKVLNEAIQNVDSSLVVFLNADAVLLTPDSLSVLLAAFQDKKVQGAFGRQVPRSDAAGWVRRDYKKSFPKEAPTPPWIPFSLPLAAIRRSAWQEHPFYTCAWASEDVEWGLWAKNRGYQIQYIPEATVMHSHNYTYRQLYRRRFVEGEADAVIYGKKSTGWTSAIGATLADAWHGSLSLRRFVAQWGYREGYKKRL